LEKILFDAEKNHFVPHQLFFKDFAEPLYNKFIFKAVRYLWVPQAGSVVAVIMDEQLLVN
jgi:hypothetical protein